MDELRAGSQRDRDPGRCWLHVDAQTRLPFCLATVASQGSLTPDVQMALVHRRSVGRMGCGP